MDLSGSPLAVGQVPGWLFRLQRRGLSLVRRRIRQLRLKGFQLLNKLRDVFRGRVPDDVHVCLHVLVDEDVPHLFHDSPWNFRMCRLEVVGNRGGGLANENEVITERIGVGLNGQSLVLGMRDNVGNLCCRLENMRNSQFVGNHTVYVVVNREDMSRWNMAPGDARSFVSQFMGVREIECWAVFTEKTGEDGSVLFDGSLRSAHVQLNDLAANYHGGGHRNACGVKNLSYEDLKQLLGQMSERAEAYLS